MKNDAIIKSLMSRVEKLEREVFGASLARGTRRAVRRARSSVPTSAEPDFSVPLRPFVKKHAKGMSGPKIFTLLVAHLTSADPNKRVSMVDVTKTWNKLTGLLGIPFNSAHSTRARDYDWVAAEKTGSYHLRPNWKKIFS